MRGNVSARIVKLEQERRARLPQVILWTDPDNPDAEPEEIELCGLSHEECLALLDEEETQQ
jgi:hypothetical protein